MSTIKKKRDIERRRFLRQPIDLSVEVTIMERNAWTNGKIVNISKEGFCLVTECFLKEGQMILIKGDIRDRTPSHGIVRWVKEANNHYMVGFELLKQQ